MNTIALNTPTSTKEISDLLVGDPTLPIPVLTTEQDFSECLKDAADFDNKEIIIEDTVREENQISSKAEKEPVERIESELLFNPEMPVVIQMLEKPVEGIREDFLENEASVVINDFERSAHEIEIPESEVEIFEQEEIHENALLHSSAHFAPSISFHNENEAVKMSSQEQRDLTVADASNDNEIQESISELSEVLSDKMIHDENDIEQSPLSSIETSVATEAKMDFSKTEIRDSQIQGFDIKEPLLNQELAPLKENFARTDSEPSISENPVAALQKSQESGQATFQASPQVTSMNYDLKPSLLQHLAYLEDNQPATLKVNLKLDPQGNDAVDMQVKLTSSGKLQVNFESMPLELQELTQAAWNDLQPTILSKGWKLDGPHFDGMAREAVEQTPADQLGIKNFLRNFLQSPLSKGIVPKALARLRSDRSALDKAEPNF